MLNWCGQRQGSFLLPPVCSASAADLLEAATDQSSTQSSQPASELEHNQRQTALPATEHSRATPFQAPVRPPASLRGHRRRQLPPGRLQRRCFSLPLPQGPGLPAPPTRPVCMNTTMQGLLVDFWRSLGGQAPPGAEFLEACAWRAAAVPEAERAPEVSAFLEITQLLREVGELLPPLSGEWERGGLAGWLCSSRRLSSPAQLGCRAPPATSPPPVSTLSSSRRHRHAGAVASHGARAGRRRWRPGSASRVPDGVGSPHLLANLRESALEGAWSLHATWMVSQIVMRCAPCPWLPACLPAVPGQARGLDDCKRPV